MAQRRAFQAILAQQWCMREDSLRQMLAIALRTNLDPQTIAEQRGQPLDNTQETVVRDGVAIVPIIGPVFRYANLFTMISGGTSTDMLGLDIATAIRNPDVKAIVLEIDSPGGQAAGIHELAELIRAGSAQKPVVAYVGNMAASAGYWLAAAAGEIVMDDMAMVGSIGVVRAVLDPKKAEEDTIEFVSSQSPMKRPDPHDDAGRASIQAEVDDMAAVFIASVARLRDTTEETVLSDFGQGAVLVGQKAVDAGMADRLGSLEEVIRDLAQRPAASVSAVAPTATRTRTPQRTGTTPAASTQRRTPMPKKSMWDVLRENLTGISADSESDGTELIATVEQTNGPVSQGTQLAGFANYGDDTAAEIARLKAENAQLKQASASASVQGWEADAVAFADAQVQAGRAFPAERDELEAIYRQALADDAKYGLAAGPGGTARTRVQALHAAYEKRTPHGLTSERAQITGDAPNTSTVLGATQTPRVSINGNEQGPLTADRRRELLAQTEMGQKLLEREARRK